MAKLFREYSFCSSQVNSYSFVFDPQTLDAYAITVAAPSPPSWIVFTDDNGYEIVPYLIADGQYLFYFTFTNKITGEVIQWVVVVNIVSGLNCSPTEYELKNCGSRTHIVWLNQCGGYENYIFTGFRITSEIGGGDSDTYKTQGYELRNNSIKDSYISLTIGTGWIPKEHLAKLKSLQMSLQAWEFNENLPSYLDWSERFTPIILDRDKLLIQDTREDLVKRNITYRISKENIIQNQ